MALEDFDTLILEEPDFDPDADLDELDELILSEDDDDFDPDDSLAFESDMRRGVYDDWPDPNEY